jgi:Domain of unknown function (DUF397)
MAPRHPDLSQAIWRKSSHSSSTGQNCVEVATNLHGVVAVRDSKNFDGPPLIVRRSDWRAFILDLKSKTIAKGGANHPLR